MEQNNKYLLLKIMHMICIFVSLELCIFTLIMNGGSFGGVLNTVLYYIYDAVIISALVFGSIYLLKGHSKSEAVYYRTFMCLICAVFIADAVITYFDSDVPLYRTLLCIIPVISAVILAFGLNPGKAKSAALVSVMIAFQTAFLVIDLIIFGTDGNGKTILVQNLACIFLAGTSAIMVYEKYLDKAARASAAEYVK